MAFSNWLMVHGTSARVQDSRVVKSMGYYGWGVDVVLYSGSPVWVHIPVPTMMLGTFSRSIRIYFHAGRSVRIDQLHVWNGGTKVVEFTDLDLQQGPYKELELSPPVYFESGMGLSLLVKGSEADPTDESMKFILNGAGALFEES